MTEHHEYQPLCLFDGKFHPLHSFSVNESRSSHPTRGTEIDAKIVTPREDAYWCRNDVGRVFIFTDRRTIILEGCYVTGLVGSPPGPCEISMMATERRIDAR